MKLVWILGLWASALFGAIEPRARLMQDFDWPVFPASKPTKSRIKQPGNSSL